MALRKTNAMNFEMVAGDTEAFFWNVDTLYQWRAGDFCLVTFTNGSGDRLESLCREVVPDEDGRFWLYLRSGDTADLAAGGYTWSRRYYLGVVRDDSGKVVSFEQCKTPDNGTSTMTIIRKNGGVEL